jgi:tripartite-type tricarboxylate transporter receptor subunit TctC
MEPAMNPVKLFLCTVMATALPLSPAWAQSTPYPAKAVSLMVPYPAGGPSDAIARIFNTALSKDLQQPVIVENLGGVSGALAAQKVLSAPADGYYLFQGSSNEVVLSPLANASVKLKAEDFRLVHPIIDAVMVVLTRSDLGVSSVDELIALARRSPRPLTYGSVGIGSLYHFIVEDMQQRAGVKMSHVPYKGNAPVIADIGGRHVDFAVLVYSAAMGAMADQGKLKVIGQLGAARSPLLPNVPTVSEGNELKNFSYRQWAGFMVPRATPEPVVERLHQAIGNALNDETVRSQLAAQTMTPSAAISLPEASQLFETETARYRAIAKRIQLQPQ